MKEPSTTKKRVHRVLDVLAWTCLAAGVLGLSMRYIVRDHVAALAAVFYALPPLVAVVLFTVSLGLSFRRPHKRCRAAASGILVVLALAAWVQTDFVWARSAVPVGDSLRVVLWNLARPSLTDESFVRVLQEADAQVLFLVETGDHAAARRRFWEAHFPEHHVSLSAGQIALLSKYPIANVRCTTVGTATRIAECDLVLPGGTVSVVAVDVESAYCHRRRIAFQQIDAIVGAQRHPVVVLGDFNTPHTSIRFEELRRSFRHTFERSGTGLITTWPAFFPVLALDHVWVSEGIVPVRTELRRTRHSDHAMVIADVAIETLAPPPGEKEATNGE